MRVLDNSTQLEIEPVLIGGLIAPLSLAVLILWFSTEKIADYASNVLGKLQRKQLEKKETAKALDKDEIISSLQLRIIGLEQELSGHRNYRGE